MRRPVGLSGPELRAFIESRSTPCPMTGCWWWLGATVCGYARMGFGRQKSATVTRVLLGLELGDPREALHSCDNPFCVNPAHLSIGTHAENMAEMKRKGRARSGWEGPLYTVGGRSDRTPAPGVR